MDRDHCDRWRTRSRVERQGVPRHTRSVAPDNAQRVATLVVAVRREIDFVQSSAAEERSPFGHGKQRVEVSLHPTRSALEE